MNRALKRIVLSGSMVAVVGSGMLVTIVANAAENPTAAELMSRCNTAESCTYTVTSSTRWWNNSGRHKVGSTVDNCEDNPISRTFTFSDTVSSSSNLGVNLSVTGGFANALNLAFTSSFGVSWADSHTETESITETVSPLHRAEIRRTAAMVETVGDWEIRFRDPLTGHKVWRVKDASFEMEDPADNGELAFTSRSFTAEEMRSICGLDQPAPPASAITKNLEELPGPQDDPQPVAVVEPGDAAVE